MAKFCTKCGKKLEEGKKCECKKDSEVNINTEVLNDIVDNYIKVSKRIFVYPFDTIKDYSKRSKFNIGIIMIIISSIISGLFMYLLANESVFSMNSMINNFSNFNLTVSSNVSIKVFLIFTLLVAAYNFCFGGLLHIILRKVLKTESDIKKIYALIGVSSVFITITTLVALIFIYINIRLSLLILTVSFFIHLFNLFFGFNEIIKIDKNKYVYVFTSAYLIALFVSLYLLPQIFL